MHLYEAFAQTLRLALTELTSMCTLSSALKTLGFILLLANLKNVPLVYHLRVLNGIRFVLRSQRPTIQLGPEHLFQPLITTSRAPLMEIDIFGHKSNSSYFTDIDIARAHYVSTMFSESIERLRGSTTMNGLSGKQKSAFTMPLGAVSCSFRKEIKPYETYDLWTRILSWDDKWLYLVTHFVKRSSGIEPNHYILYPKQGWSRSGCPTKQKSEPPSHMVAATALSKVVFKDGRRTLAPSLMLELAGLLPVGHCAKTVEEYTATLSDDEAKSSSDDSGYDSPRTGSSEREMLKAGHRIEEERRRGLKLAELLGKQIELVEEFNSQSCLGRHYDGFGIEGVVTTLAQLGRLSNYQLL